VTSKNKQGKTINYNTNTTYATRRNKNPNKPIKQIEHEQKPVRNKNKNYKKDKKDSFVVDDDATETVDGDKSEDEEVDNVRMNFNTVNKNKKVLVKGNPNKEKSNVNVQKLQQPLEQIDEILVVDTGKKKIEIKNKLSLVQNNNTECSYCHKDGNLIKCYGCVKSFHYNCSKATDFRIHKN